MTCYRTQKSAPEIALIERIIF